MTKQHVQNFNKGLQVFRKTKIVFFGITIATLLLWVLSHDLVITGKIPYQVYNGLTFFRTVLLIILGLMVILEPVLKIIQVKTFLLYVKQNIFTDKTINKETFRKTLGVQEENLINLGITYQQIEFTFTDFKTALNKMSKNSEYKGKLVIPGLNPGSLTIPE